MDSTAQTASLTISIVCHEVTKQLCETVSTLLELDWITHIQLVDTSLQASCQEIGSSSALQSGKLQYHSVPTSPEKIDFSKIRNFAIGAISDQWVFFLDSDESLDAIALESIKDCVIDKTSIQTIHGATMQRVDYFHGYQLQYGETGNVFLLRLAQTRYAGFARAVHEVMELSVPKNQKPQVVRLLGTIKHHSHANLAEFITSVSLYAHLDSKHRNWNKKTLLELLFFPLAKFIQNFIGRQGFRDGYAGLAYAVAMSLHSLLVRVYTFESYMKIKDKHEK